MYPDLFSVCICVISMCSECERIMHGIEIDRNVSWLVTKDKALYTEYGYPYGYIDLFALSSAVAYFCTLTRQGVFGCEHPLQPPHAFGAIAVAGRMSILGHAALASRHHPWWRSY